MDVLVLIVSGVAVVQNLIIPVMYFCATGEGKDKEVQSVPVSQENRTLEYEYVPLKGELSNINS